MKFIFTILISLSLKGYRVDSLLNSEMVEIETFPYMVALILRQDKENIPEDIFRGSGGIIQPYFAITAAKCLLLVSEEQIENQQFYVRGNTSFWKKPGVDHLIVKKYEHPYHHQPEHDFNIGLVKVKEPFKAEYEHQLILPKNNFYDGGWFANITGWGTTNKDRGEPENQLQTIKIEVVNRATCRSLYNLQWTPRLFCAGESFQGRPGPCYYDTGDPVVYKQILIGLASKLSCGEKTPDIYVSIFPLKRWINGLLLTETN